MSPSVTATNSWVQIMMGRFISGWGVGGCSAAGKWCLLRLTSVRRLRRPVDSSRLPIRNRSEAIARHPHRHLPINDHSGHPGGLLHLDWHTRARQLRVMEDRYRFGNLLCLGARCRDHACTYLVAKAGKSFSCLHGCSAMAGSRVP